MGGQVASIEHVDRFPQVFLFFITLIWKKFPALEVMMDSAEGHDCSVEYDHCIIHVGKRGYTSIYIHGNASDIISECQLSKLQAVAWWNAKVKVSRSMHNIFS